MKPAKNITKINIQRDESDESSSDQQVLLTFLKEVLWSFDITLSKVSTDIFVLSIIFECGVSACAVILKVYRNCGWHEPFILPGMCLVSSVVECIGPFPRWKIHYTWPIRADGGWVKGYGLVPIGILLVGCRWLRDKVYRHVNQSRFVCAEELDTCRDDYPECGKTPPIQGAGTLEQLCKLDPR